MGGIVFCGYDSCAKVKSDYVKTIRKVKLVDLPNHVDPNSIQDKHEKVRYLFPFYRSDISPFE